MSKPWNALHDVQAGNWIITSAQGALLLAAEHDGERGRGPVEEAVEAVNAIAALKAENEQLGTENDALKDTLRSLACWLGVGGYNALDVDALEFEAKIRDGVNSLVKAEVERRIPGERWDAKHKAIEHYVGEIERLQQLLRQFMPGCIDCGTWPCECSTSAR